MTIGIKTSPTKSKLTNTVNSLKASFFEVLWVKTIVSAGYALRFGRSS